MNMKKYVADVRVRKIDVNENTYHDVTIYNMFGAQVAEVKKVYGYGSQYVETTRNLIKKEVGEINYTTEQTNAEVLFTVHKY